MLAAKAPGQGFEPWIPEGTRFPGVRLTTRPSRLIRTYRSRLFKGFAFGASVSPVVADAADEQPEPPLGVVAAHRRRREDGDGYRGDRADSEKPATDEEIRPVGDEKRERADDPPQQRG